MSWQFWKKRKKPRVIEPITKGQSEHGGRDLPAGDSMFRALPDPNTPIPGRPERVYVTGDPMPYVELTAASMNARIGVEGKAQAKTLSTTSIPSPMIHQITAPIVWRDDAVGTRYGPGRCSPECTEVHAYAVKVSPTVVAFERPCVPEDMGAAEWRARQKRG